MSQDQMGRPRQPVPLVHVDYTATSGVQRLNALLPEEADRLRETPFAVVQVTHHPGFETVHQESIGEKCILTSAGAYLH